MMNITDKIVLDHNLDKTYILRIVSRSTFYYKDYYVPKRNGSKRFISQPSPELKTLQYWVVHNILNKIEVSKAAFAYKKGDSIKKHALIHKDSKYIFHTDIQNFFPSIHFSHLYEILRSNKRIFDELGLDLEESIQEIKKICFRNDCLCIGAVSSPAISNIIMFPFDEVVNKYCEEQGYVYSRYADDIYISSLQYINKDLSSFISKELDSLNFRINNSKTRYYSRKYRRKVTGIVLTDDFQISVGTERRVYVKKLVYNKLVHNIGDSNEILGYLSFIKDIEPHTYDNIIIKYSKYCDEDIIEALNK